MLAIEIDHGGLDPEAAGRLDARSVRLVRATSARHGGWVHAASGGRISVIFIPPFLHDLPSRAAVQTAAELAESFPRTEGAGTAIRWSMSVASGEIITAPGPVEATAMSGTPLQVARQLVDSADSFETVLDDETRAAVDGSQETEIHPRPHGWLLDGRPRPQRVKDGLPLVGRAPAMQAIVRAYEEASGERAARRVLLWGPPGLGKSRLIEEATKRLRTDATVITGYCDPSGGGLAPLARALEQLLGPQAAGSLDERLAPFLPDPEERSVTAEHLAHVFGHAKASSFPENILWGVRRLIESAAADRTLVLILEDLQWAGQVLIDAIEYLTGFIKASPVLLICSTRPELFSSHPSMRRESSGAETIRLTEFGLEEIEELTTAFLGRPAPQAVIDRIHEVGKGNPFYAIEMIAEWRRSEASDSDHLTIPGTMSSLWETRISTLGEEELSVIESASVVGSRFRIEDVSAVAGQTDVGVLLRLAHLTEQHLVERDPHSEVGTDEFRFVHGLIAETVYGMAGKDRRARLHQSYAQHLEAHPDRYDHAGSIGYHLERAVVLRTQLGDSSPAVDDLSLRAAKALVEAATGAGRAGDLQGVVNLLERSLGLFPRQDSDWLRAADTLADGLLQVGEEQRARRVCAGIAEMAEASRDPEYQARAALAVGVLNASTTATPDPGAIDDLAALIPVFQSTGDRFAQMRLQMAIAERHWTAMHCGAARESLTKALEHALELDEIQHVARIAGFLCAVMTWGPTPVAEAIAACEDLYSVVGRDPVSRARIRAYSGVLVALNGDVDEGRLRTSKGSSELGEMGHAVAAATSSEHAGFIELLAGDMEAASNVLSRGLESMRALEVTGFDTTCLAALAHVTYELGKSDAARAMAEEALAMGEGDVTVIPDAYPVLAHLAADRRDRDAAIDYLDRAAEALEDQDTLLAEAKVAVERARVFKKIATLAERRQAVAHAEQLCHLKGARTLAARIPPAV